MGQSSLKSILSRSAKAKNLNEQNVVPVLMCKRNIKDDDILRLAEQWSKDVTSLVLHDNQITSKGLLYFSTVPWTNLVNIALNNNFVTNIGCKYLSRASIKNITRISLTKNLITDDGLIHLSKAQWNNIQEMSLTLNQICSIQSLTKVKWSKLSALYLASSSLQIEGALWVVFIKVRQLRSFSIAKSRFSENQKLKIKTLSQKIHQNVCVNM